jgi:hypothetical protein
MLKSLSKEDKAEIDVFAKAWTTAAAAGRIVTDEALQLPVSPPFEALERDVHRHDPENGLAFRLGT